MRSGSRDDASRRSTSASDAVELGADDAVVLAVPPFIAKDAGARPHGAG